MGDKVQPPEGFYYDYDLGAFLPIPTETSMMEATIPRQAQTEKAATLRGERPTEQTLRDRGVRRQAAHGKDQQGRGR